MRHLLTTCLLTLTTLVITGFPALAEVQTREIAYDFEGTEHLGILAWDDAGADPRPGVLVVHEWTGRGDYVVRRARELAEMGYVAFAADYYGGGQSTTDRGQAAAWAGAARSDLDRFQRLGQAALSVLASQPEVDSSQLAAIGFCFGGTASLQLAFSGADLDAVVSFHGNPTAPRPGEVEQITGELLVLHGAVDPYVKAEDIAAFKAAMEAAGVPYEWVDYGGAVHNFTHPGAGDDPSTGAAYQERAARRAWEAMRVFFREIFGR